jgi:thioredoxin 1
MKWLLALFLVLLLGPVKVVVVSNSIDYSPELISYIGQEFDVITITADEVPDYQNYSYFVILGGPDAPEGIGELVSNILSIQEQNYLRTTDEYNLFVRVKDGRTYLVLAGSDREQTKLAVDTLKDNVLTYLPKEPMKWMDDYDAAVQKAQTENKLIYIDFYTDWCRYCMQMDEETYTDPRIIKLLTEDFVAVKLNREDPKNQDIVSKYRIFGQPVEIVITPEGDAVWGHQGFLDAPELYYYLTTILSETQ